MKTELAKMRCQPCGSGASPLKGEALTKLAEQLDEGWRVVYRHHLERRFLFPDFRQALDFTNRVGELAEEQQHHPDIYLAWGEVRLQICTHKIDGLTESDFIFAAKVSALNPNPDMAQVEHA